MTDNAAGDVGEAAFLREFLAGRDATCPGCGYNLRDLAGERCPECGLGVEVGLKLAEPKQGAMILGLVGLSTGLGFGALVAVWILLIFGRRATSINSDALRGLLLGISGGVVHGVAMVAWLRRWRRIRLMGAEGRWALACACWVLPVVLVVLFATFVK